MPDITIPAAALEKGVRAAIALDSGPEGSKLFEIHYAEFAEGYRASIRAAFLATLNAWEGAKTIRDNGRRQTYAIPALILPLPQENSDEQ